MLQTKVLEIRDRGTFLVVLATKIARTGHDQADWLLKAAGFSLNYDDYVFLCKVQGGKYAGTADPFDWGTNPRTYFLAHRYIAANFDSLEEGQVVDVEFVEGEAKEPKASDRGYVPATK